jgi:hypothetical protein
MKDGRQLILYINIAAHRTVDLLQGSRTVASRQNRTKSILGRQDMRGQDSDRTQDRGRRSRSPQDRSSEERNQQSEGLENVHILKVASVNVTQCGVVW